MGNNKNYELILREKKMKINLLNLIDINLLQEFQDSFAIAMGVASLTVDDNGPITKPSNFTDYCIKYTRKSQLGLSRCNQCDINWGKIAAQKGKPVVYSCHAGLTDFAVPIIVRGEHIASILGGQVLTTEPDEKFFSKIAKELSIPEADYLKALKNVKILPKDRVEAAANLLYIVANAISKIALKNLELQENERKNTIYSNIVETIRNTPNIEDIKEKIVEIVGETLNADRCFISEYDKKTNKHQNVEYEYLSSKEISPYKGTDVNQDVPKFAALLQEGKNIIINNKKIYSNENESTFVMEKIAIEKNNVTSAFAFPLYYLGEYIGFLALHYVKQQHYMSKDEMELLENVAKQISIAINRANLFEALRQTTANQNAVLNNIPHMAWMKDINSNYITVNKAFARLCNTTIDELIGKNDFDFFPEEHAKAYRNDDIKVIESKQPIHLEELIEVEDGTRWHETYKSPIFNTKGEAIGTVGLAYDITERKEYELALLKHQEQIEIANKREKINRNITEILRSTLDRGTIKHLFVENIGKSLKADRVLFSEYNAKTKTYMPVQSGDEYLASKDEISFIGYDWNCAEAREYIAPLLEKRELNIPSWDKYIATNSKSNEFKNLFENANVKSSYNFPVLYQEEIMGYFCIEYTKYENRLSGEDIQMIRNICTQAGIALYHANLYINAQKSSKSKGEFIANISKEAEYPLDSIVGFWDELIKANLGQEWEDKYLHKAEQYREIVNELKNDLILISKIESDDFSLKIDRIDIEEIINELIKNFDKKLKAKNISVNTDINDKFFTNDKDIIYNTTRNLIFLLVDAMPQNAKIFIKTYIEENKMVTIIEDIGENIEAQNAVFEKLKQLDFNFPRKLYGKGLKILITRKLIEIIKGHISVDSTESLGIMIITKLPNLEKI